MKARVVQLHTNSFMMAWSSGEMPLVLMYTTESDGKNRSRKKKKYFEERENNWGRIQFYRSNNCSITNERERTQSYCKTKSPG